jgi:alkylhydroperoxidase family enzyme
MSRIKSTQPAEATELGPALNEVVERMGFLPQSHVVMRNVPGLSEALAALARVVFRPDAKTSPLLRNLVAQVSSQAAGCTYCWAHSASNALRSGVEEAKIAAVWDFETSTLFTEAERAALRFAAAAAVIPNAVDDNMMDELRRHFDDREMTELTAVIAVMGFLNRWNDTLATDLEDLPRSVAERTLGPSGWTIGKHGGPTDDLT